MSLAELLTVLSARRRSLFIGALTVALLGAVLGSLWPRKYLATAQVMIDVKAPDPILGAMFSASLLPSYIATQIELISGDLVAHKAVQRLQLQADPDRVEEWKRWAHEDEPFDAYYERQLEKFLDVKAAKQSNIIAISYKSGSPEFAARVANAVAETYLETELDVKRQGAERYAVWFDNRLKELRGRLERTQQALSDYQSRLGIVSIDERLDIESSRLSELSAQIAGAQSAVAAAQSRSEANQQGEITPESQAPAVVQSLRSQLAKLRAEYEAASARLGPNHPAQQALRGQIAETEAALAREQANTRQTVASTASGARLNEQRLRDALSEQRRKVLELQQHRAEISVLQRDLRSAQSAFDAAAGRRNQLDLISESPESSATLLMAATAPFRPSSPKLLLLLVLITFASGASGLLCALLRERRDPRVRNVQQLLSMSAAPVLEFGSPAALPAVRRLNFVRFPPLSTSPP